MLFHPPLDQNIGAVQAMLNSWNSDADRLRQAAQAARSEGVALSYAVSGARDARAGLSSLVEELDDALQRVASGTRLLSDLLHVQARAIALLKSLYNTHDILDRYVTVQVSDPISIAPRASAES